MCWSGDEQCEGLASDGLYRHAQRLSRPVANGAGDVEARSDERHLFVFRGLSGGLIKVIWHDGQGACLFSKKLERGRFIGPSAADGTVVITPAQLGYLLECIDWRMPQETCRPTSAG